MFQQIKKHMKGQKANPAEEFKLSSQDVFPSLIAMYWANPNDQKGTIERCSYHSGLKEKSVHKEGI